MNVELKKPTQPIVDGVRNMFGRMDIGLFGNCRECNGSGRSRKNRKRKCPKCSGSGKKVVCFSCGDEMPCSGTEEDMMDQSWCSLKK